MGLKGDRFYKDQLEAISANPKKVYYSWEAEFIADGEVLKATRMIDFDDACDYERGHSPTTSITVSVPLHDYQRFLYPKRKNLTVMIRKKGLGETEDFERNDEYETDYYRVVDLINTDPSTLMNSSVDETGTLTTLTFQLIDASIYQLKMRTVGGVFKKHTAADVVKVLLGKYSMDLNLPKEQAVKGVVMVAPNVTEPKNHVLIEHGTPILDLAGYAQVNCGGIYNAQIGCFLSNRFWYVFPIYDTSRYNKSIRTLDIILTTSNLNAGRDKTYILQEHRLTVAVTGEVDQRDTSDSDYLEYGNGVRYAKAKNIFNDFTAVDSNVATADVNHNTTQMVIDSREDRKESVPFSERRITDNVARELSALAPRNGQYVELMWNYSNSELLIPGMPVKLHYPVVGGVVEKLGVLLAHQTNASTSGTGLTATRFVSSTLLKVFVEK